MSEYLFEMHAHTNDVSRCAVSTPEELAELYKKTDYAGIVLTNHMNPWTFKINDLENKPWKDKAEHFISGYRHLKNAAGNDLIILLGMEIRFYDHPNDYLVYGVTEDFIKNNGDLMALNPKSFSKLAHENGLLFLQAHPFRRDMQVEDWKILDGYEVFNGNPRHYSSNEIAEEWAKMHNKNIVVSGSDFHEEEDVAHGGVYFKEPVNNNDDLLCQLRSGSYRLKKIDLIHTREE